MNIEQLFANPVSTGYQLGATPQPTGEGLTVRTQWLQDGVMEWTTQTTLKKGPVTPQEIEKIRQMKGTGKPRSAKLKRQEIANYQFVRDLLCEVPRLRLHEIEQRCKGRRGLSSRYLSDIKCALLRANV